jgi:ribonuclease HI
MSLICWNCRGAGNAATVRELREIVGKYAPSILCILETQINKDRVEGLSGSIGFDNGYAIDSSGRSGGIGVFWNNEIKLNCLGYSKYHIDFSVDDLGSVPWRLTCVYGEAQVSERYKTWDTLKGMASNSPLPWLCIGDFNEVLRQDEHIGIGPRSQAQIQGFRDTVDICGLNDLGFTGSSWTYEKKVAGGTYTRVRLDRALCSMDWMTSFPQAVVNHLTAATSDHKPIQIQFEVPAIRKGPHQFRFELMWETHEELKPTVVAGWNTTTIATTVKGVMEKLKGLSANLTRWNRDSFGSVRKQIKNMKIELEQLQGDPARSGPTHAELKIVEKLVELYYREEVMWRQRSRVQWLAAGDKNTKFFHQRACMRRRKNLIKSLTKLDGTITNDPLEMQALAKEFYHELFTSQGVNGMDAVLEHVPQKVTANMNESLTAPYTEEEVKVALFQMFPSKAPGPDGYPAHFFQRHWDICGKEITTAVLNIVTGKESAESINDTILVLIPKVPNPSLLSQFRPISLCNVLYKIASKVIANRLKVVLPDIISEEQSAFVPGRLITDNIISAYECLHFMKRNRAKTNSFAALKLDMMKAYDRVEWQYLEAIMRKLGFDHHWISVVMGMVRTVSFSVLFNGQRLDEFRPSRGIRQGDPISPYLFLLAAEGLSGLLKSNQSLHLSGIKVATSAPPVNHLLFADDSLLFFKASVEGAQEVSYLLDVYCQASGQRINRDKSSIFFSKGCPSSVREEVKLSLQVINEALTERYLGMPTDVGHSKNGTFKYLKDRIWSRIKGWLEKILSAGGKEVLIKSVAQALPVYSMACFRLPRGLCEHINSLIRGFWWGSREGKRKPHWVSWQVMTSPKFMGGLGFRDLELFNLALLAKQSWRLLQEPMSLSARILKAVYYPATSILEAELGSNPSQIWRAILDGREVLKQGLIRRIGNGYSTKIWGCNWIPREPLLRPLLPLVPNPPTMVHEIINHSEATWNSNLIRQVFLPMDAEAILSIPLCTGGVTDFWAWYFERKGYFTVRSAYRMLIDTKTRRENWLDGIPGSSNSQLVGKAWAKLWKLSVPSKLKIFVWRLAHQSLPSSDLLHHRHMATSDSCALCGCQDSWRHSLLDCTTSRCTWALCDEGIIECISACTEPNAKNWLFSMSDSLSHVDFTKLVVTLWAIWSARRKAIHEDIFQSPNSIHNFVNSYLAELNAIQTPKPIRTSLVPDTSKRWLPPEIGCNKINVDGGFGRSGRRAAAAAICRTEQGSYLGASAIVVEGIKDPASMEALACREGLALAEDLSIARLVVASDSQNVVRDIQQHATGTYGAIIREISQRKSRFDKCTFVYERRNSNYEAHIIAKHAAELGVGRHVWLGYPHDPTVIHVNIAMND